MNRLQNWNVKTKKEKRKKEKKEELLVLLILLPSLELESNGDKNWTELNCHPAPLFSLVIRSAYPRSYNTRCEWCLSGLNLKPV
jgi:hypothetical protein